MKAVFGENRAIYLFRGWACFALATRTFPAFLAGALASVSRGVKRPIPGIANIPVFWERSAICDKTIASRFDTPSLFAVSMTEGKVVVTLTGRAMTNLIMARATPSERFLPVVLRPPTGPHSSPILG